MEKEDNEKIVKKLITYEEWIGTKNFKLVADEKGGPDYLDIWDSDGKRMIIHEPVALFKFLSEAIEHCKTSYPK